MKDEGASFLHSMWEYCFSILKKNNQVPRRELAKAGYRISKQQLWLVLAGFISVAGLIQTLNLPVSQCDNTCVWPVIQGNKENSLIMYLCQYAVFQHVRRDPMSLLPLKSSGKALRYRGNLFDLPWSVCWNLTSTTTCCPYPPLLKLNISWPHTSLHVSSTHTQ